MGVCEFHVNKQRNKITIHTPQVAGQHQRSIKIVIKYCQQIDVNFLMKSM